MTRVPGLLAPTILVAGMLSAFPALAPSASAAPDQFAQATSTQAAAPAPTKATSGHDRGAQSATHTRTQLVEYMISDMRTKLQITAAEQSQFDAVAGIMRANAKAMEALLAERARDTDRSAVASLRWYGRLTDAHAAGLKAFTPVFESLYTTLSDRQRKAADTMFSRLAQRPVTAKSR